MKYYQSFERNWGDSTLCFDGGRLNWGKRGKSGERGEAAACHRHNNVCPHISHIPHSGNCTENKSEQCRSLPPGALTPNRHNLGNLGFYSPKYLLPPNNHISFAFGVGRHLEPPSNGQLLYSQHGMSGHFNINWHNIWYTCGWNKLYLRWYLF